MKTKILMVYPEFPTTYWSFKHAMNFIGKKAAFPPLGLMTVAAMLPDNFEAKIIDMNAGKLRDEDILNSDMVFISAMIVQKDSFRKVALRAKELGKVVVAGGPYPTSSDEAIENVDHFILNEAEITLPRFIEDYLHGKPAKIYTDTAKPDMTKTPVPRYDLIDVNLYSNMLLQFSRGCPFSCEFCDIIEMFGRITRTKTNEQFLNELDTVYNTGFRGSLFIVDDNFIGNKKRVKELLKDLIIWQEEKNHPFAFFTEASINCADDEELLDLLQGAGFDMLFVGIETPDEAALASAHKNQNLKVDLIESVKKMQRHGMEVTGGFIVGFDTDNETIFDRQINFIQKAGIPTAMMGLLNALPNTQLYRRLKSENRLLPASSSGNNTHELKLNFIPVMEEEKLIEGYKKIISALYSPKNYFDRCLTLIKELPSNSKSVRKVSLTDLKSLFMSLFKQGFSSYGAIYFKFLFKSLIYNSRLFDEAVSSAIKGFHFFKMTEEIFKADRFKALLTETEQRLYDKLVEIVTAKGKYAYHEAEAIYSRMLHKVRKKYNRLASETKIYVEDTFNEFEAKCADLFTKLKKEFHIQDGYDNIA